ncbi:MAG: hypothetical protein KME46_26140 [Brasilonema angustatum HA4187-MV1]|jgi:ribosomal protein L21|nr:hypothetical protein [Brasilonema angustatum HA4187-MV1]
MGNVNKMNIRLSSNDKVIVEELIENELEGIVGGVTSTLVSNVTAVSTDGNDVSINDVKIDIKNDSKNIKKIVTKVKKRTKYKRTVST